MDSATAHAPSEFVLRFPTFKPSLKAEDIKTEPVGDSRDYSEMRSRPSVIKSEDIEESIEEKSGYMMSREEDITVSNIKGEDEEGGERQSEGKWMTDAVKSEEIRGFELGQEERDESYLKTNQTERLQSEEGIKEEVEGSLPSATSCLLKQARLPSSGSPALSSIKGETEVFACSQCPFIHMEEEKRSQHIEKVHLEHGRILGYASFTAEDIKTEPVVDSRDYSEMWSRPSVIKSEDTEESIEEKSGYMMSREEDITVSNIKGEEEEGGQRQSEDIWMTDAVKSEEIRGFELGQEERDESYVKTNQTERLQSDEGIKEEEEGSLPSATSCLLKQARLPSSGSPALSSIKDVIFTVKVHSMSKERLRCLPAPSALSFTWKKRNCTSTLRRFTLSTREFWDMQKMEERTYCLPLPQQCSPPQYSPTQVLQGPTSALSPLIKLPVEDLLIALRSLKQSSHSYLSCTGGVLCPASLSEEMNTEPVMDSIDNKETVLGCFMIKSEDTEESVEEKNGYKLSKEEELMLTNIKEEEEGGERWSEEVKREWEQEKEGDEILSKSKGSEGWLIEEGVPVGEIWKEEGSSPLGASCLLKQPGMALQGSPVKSSIKGESEVVISSQCPYFHMEDLKLHQYSEKVQPVEDKTIMGFEGTGAVKPLPPSRAHQHPTLPRTVATPAQPQTGQSEVFSSSQCPFPLTEEIKLHQHIENVYPEKHKRILGYVGNGAENQLPPGCSNEHHTPPETLPTPIQPHKEMACDFLVNLGAQETARLTVRHPFLH
ncbi:hypothetical protein GJAV_G00072070 [Gymnothorax javanicus]|nr:hypothetical protein GJAV_G00072070 [Gymnothorax javanicus]